MKNPIITSACWMFLTGPGVRFYPKDALQSKFFWLSLLVMVIASIMYKNKHQIMAKLKSTVAPFTPASDVPKISYSSDGRSGYVHYRSKAGNFDMYYEFGGGNVVVGINVPSSNDWVAQTGIPLEQREEVLNQIGQQVVKDQTTNGRGSFKIEGNFLNIYV